MAFHLRREFGNNDQVRIIHDLLIEHAGERARFQGWPGLCDVNYFGRLATIKMAGALPRRNGYPQEGVASHTKLPRAVSEVVVMAKTMTTPDSR